MTTNTWPQEHLDQLLALIKNGLTLPQIAKEMGMTKNKIVGKIYRMGWRKDNHQLERIDLLQNVQIKVNLPLPKPTPTNTESKNLSLLDLQKDQCHWPTGDWLAGDKTFCGLKCSGVYCVDHNELAYVKRK